MKRASGDHPVAVALRQEVNFTCPIPRCGKAILTYHHFNPTWRDENHNRPEGMIALCKDCHGKAEGKTWTKAQLEQFKRCPPPPAPIRERFMWVEGDREVLYRLGGCYAAQHETVIAIGGHRVLWQERASDGRILLSLDVQDEFGKTLLEFRQNTLSVEMAQRWDIHINTYGNKIIFKPKKRKVVLVIHFRRLALSHLAVMLDRDESLSSQREKKPHPASFHNVESSIEGYASSLKDSIMAYATDNCRDSDGTVPLIDIENATLHANKRSLVIRPGITIGGDRDIVSSRTRVSFSFSHNNGGAAFAW